jgi:hypothetical protein
MGQRMAFSETAFRAVLFAVGLVIVWTGINVGLGGIATLGLQGPTDFMAITDPQAFAAQDSHVRFLGGLWLGVGLLLAVAAWRLRALKPAVQVVLALIVVGGLARFSALRPDVLFGPQIVGSFLAEVALMPLLLLWSTRVARRVA